MFGRKKLKRRIIWLENSLIKLEEDLKTLERDKIMDKTYFEQVITNLISNFIEFELNVREQLF